MFHLIEGEFERIDTLTSTTNFNNNMSAIGQGMVDNFNPSLNMSTSSVSGIMGGDTIINIYGDVDNERRIDEIVEAVRRELSWNNSTAGRTV